MAAFTRLLPLMILCFVGPGFVSAAEAPASPDLDPIIAEAYESVVSVVSERSDERRWVGAGVIWDGAGNVVTLTAVIDRGRRFEVVTRSGKRHGATPGGLDEVSGIAVLKVPDLRGVAVKLAEAGKLKAGEWVLAVGNPFGGGASLGIAGDLGRISISGGPGWVIRTTAAVNPGDVGGLLVNTNGEMVGLLSGRMISSIERHPLRRGPGTIRAAVELPAAAGEGLAVPADVVSRVAEELITYGRVRRAWLGLSAVPASSLKTTARLLPREGAVLVGLVEGSPAHKGNLSIGDVVVKLAGRAVRSLADLERNLMVVAPGKRIELVVLRDGQRTRLPVEVTQRNAPAKEIWLCAGGLKVRENGLVVVGEGGWLGVTAGDRIISVDRRLVNDLSGLQIALIRAPQRLTVSRGGKLVALSRSGQE